MIMPARHPDRYVIDAYTAPQSRRLVPAKPSPRDADGLEKFAFKLGAFCGWVIGMMTAAMLIYFL